MRAARETHLRRDVERYAGCLGALPRAEGRVLTIRAGIGRAAPASLRQAARRLGISTRRAAALERSGLRRLREAGRSGACGQAAAGERRSAALGGGAATGVPPLQPAVLLASHPALTDPAKLAKDGARASARDSATRGSASAPDGSGATESGGAIKRAGIVASGGVDSSKIVAYIAAFLILVLIVAALVVAWRRRREHGAPRLAEQTGTAAVWWPSSADELPPAPEEPAPQEAAPAEHVPVLTTPVEPAPVEPEAEPAAAAASSESPSYPASGPVARRQRRPAVVAAASLASLGVALLRRRRRR